MAGSTASQLWPSSEVQRRGTATSPMKPRLPATPENSAAAKGHGDSPKAVSAACVALAGPMPVMARTTSTPASRPE